jgi:uncharacterized membrane protein
MRAILLILILLVVVAIGAIATGFINLNTVQPAQAPAVVAEDGKLKVQAGQPPKLQVETGELAVGTGEATVKIPRLEVRPADGGQQPAPQQQQGQRQPPAPAQDGIADTSATQQ